MPAIGKLYSGNAISIDMVLRLSADRVIGWGAICSILFVVMALSLLNSCERKVRITYVVPVGFRGMVAIGERRGGGIPAKAASGALIFRIPANGILAVSDASAFEEWHTFDAQFADGVKIPIYPAERIATDPKRLMFFEVDATGDRTWYFFVGTEPEYDSAREMSRPKVPGVTK
jgi:hypothetical protein